MLFLTRELTPNKTNENNDNCVPYPRFELGSVVISKTTAYANSANRAKTAFYLFIIIER